MSSFLIGVIVTIIPGLIFGATLWTVAGFWVAASTRCRHPAPSPPAITPVHATAQRVLPQPAPQHVTNVFVAQPGAPLMPVDLDAIQHQPMILGAPRESA